MTLIISRTWSEMTVEIVNNDITQAKYSYTNGLGSVMCSRVCNVDLYQGLYHDQYEGLYFFYMSVPCFVQDMTFDDIFLNETNTIKLMST